MTKSKPINFSGATLTSVGGSVDPESGDYKRHFWRVELADGTIYRNNHFRWTIRIWEKEWPNPRYDGYFGSSPTLLRKVGAFDNVAIEAWVRSQPNYKADK